MPRYILTIIIFILALLSFFVNDEIQKSRVAKSLNNLDKLGKCITQYVKSEGRLPGATSTKQLKDCLYPKYISDEKIFISPVSKRYYGFNRMACGLSSRQLLDKPDTVLLFDKITTYGHFNSRVLVLFVNGRKKVMRRRAWQILEAEIYKK